MERGLYSVSVTSAHAGNGVIIGMDTHHPFEPLRQPSASVNGQDSPGEIGSPESPDDAGPLDAEEYLHQYAVRDNDRETTRYLSAATQISLDYARSVIQRVIHEPYTALAPSYGADVTVVAQWAIDSLRRRINRDAGLAATLAAGGMLAWVACALTSRLIWIPLAVLSMLVVAFSIVMREHWVRQYRILAGQMLRDNFDPATAPHLRMPRVNQRLQAIADRREGNLVVFRERAAFVGSGRRLGREQLVLDVSRGKKNFDGMSGDPLPFTNSELHSAFAAAVKDISLRDMRVEERIFVNGKHVRGNPALQRSPLEPPYSRVSQRLIRRAAEHPAPDARVYMCAEIHGWQGQLMVSMFARAVHTGGWLYIEWSFYVLPPISKEYMIVDYLYEESKFTGLRRASAWSLRKTIPALLCSPFKVMLKIVRDMSWRAHEARQGYCIRRGQAFDYGAMRSIREDASGRGRNHFFLERDEIMYVLLLQKSLIREIGNFLNEHNIDQGELDEQAQVIIDASYKNYSFHVGGNVSGANISVGDSANSGGSGGKGNS
jgi:hypothetical protein